ncbi:MAG: 6-carboxytetrahydropterin synthase [candidate division WOR-3 bacterium]|nr:6-carboxytetrahydropterin synthase [candidate division WOR-3 bacterium]
MGSIQADDHDDKPNHASKEATMWTIKVSRKFSAAHQIHGIGGKCEGIHGHNYRVEVEISARKLAKPGMIADFIEVGKKLTSILPDHKMLNEVYSFNPTSENLARQLFDDMAKFYPVSKVTVWETEESCAEYSAG